MKELAPNCDHIHLSLRDEWTQILVSSMGWVSDKTHVSHESIVRVTAVCCTSFPLAHFKGLYRHLQYHSVSVSGFI